MKKRLIASLFVYNDKCYQTVSYNSYRPLGEIESILEILDRHQVDEIIISNRMSNKNQLNLKTLEKIKNSKIQTPVTYSGGITKGSDVKEVLKYGIDRIAINSSLWKKNKINEIINAIGLQGVVGVIPFKVKGNNIYFFYSEERVFIKLENDFLHFLTSLNIEFLLIDILADGNLKGFNKDILKIFKNSQIILQGGVLSSLKELNRKNISGLAIENRLLWEELKSINLRKNSNFFINRDIEL